MYTIVPFRRAFDSAFAPLFNDHFMREFFDVNTAPEMRVDVREKEDAFLLEADLPGVKKEDISLDVNDGVLTISADINQEKKETKEGYVCNERRCGHVERSFNLEGIDVSRETLAGLLSVDRDLWRKETEGIHSFYAQFGDKLPQALREELAGLEDRLKD